MKWNRGRKSFWFLKRDGVKIVEDFLLTALIIFVKRVVSGEFKKHIIC